MNDLVDTTEMYLRTILELEEELTELRAKAVQPLRRRLPETRTAITHKFDIAGHEGYLTVGMYEDGKPGEIFITMSKEGSSISGLMDSFATAVSLALQYGVPLAVLVNKFSHTRFEPAGFTTNPDIPMAKSLIDYIFRYLATKFLSRDEQDVVGVVNRQMSLGEAPVVTGEAAAQTPDASGFATEAPAASAAAQPSDVSSPRREDQTVDQLTEAAQAARAIAAGAEPRFPHSGIPDVESMVVALRGMHEELDARFDHAFEKLEELASEIERTKISVDELRGHVGEALRDLDEQTRFCRREIRMLRDRRPKTVGDFMALNNPP